MEKLEIELLDEVYKDWSDNYKFVQDKNNKLVKKNLELQIKLNHLNENYKKLLELYRDVKTYADNIHDRDIINDVGEFIKEDLYELDHDDFFKNFEIDMEEK